MLTLTLTELHSSDSGCVTDLVWRALACSGPIGRGLFFPVAPVHSWVVVSCDVSCQGALRAAVVALWEECIIYQMTGSQKCLRMVIFFAIV